jgi:putative redox protein
MNTAPVVERDRGIAHGLAVQASIGKEPFATRLDVGSHHLLADEPDSLGGADQGPNSTQLLLASLGACAAITLKMYAQRKQWPLSAAEITVTLNPAGKSADGATDIGVTVELQGPLTREQRDRLMQIAGRCPVHRIIAGEVRITMSAA